jgi:RNA polymerase sigma-70 factor (ECF subfamily)
VSRIDAEETIRKAAPALLGFFVNRDASPEDAADLVSETLLTAWRVRKRMPEEPEAARMWLFGVARNVLSSHKRSNRRRERLTAKLVDALDHAIRSRTGHLAEDRVAEVRAAVRLLPDAERELVALVHWDGFSLVEAADLLGVPASTARSRYQSARQRLAQTLLHEDAETAS